MLVTIYIAALVAANLTVHLLGPWASPFIAFALIGLDLSLRDRLHDRYGLLNTFGLVLLAAVLSFAVNPSAGNIAAASCLAFMFAGWADSLVYEGMRKHAQLVRMNTSNTAGALVDSIVFPTLAFGAFMPEIIALQFAAKVGGGALWAYVLVKQEKAHA